MNVFNNVSNQVSGLGSSLGSWFKKDSKDEGEANIEQESENKNVVEQSEPEKKVKSKSKSEDNEDASSQHSGATEGADSNPPSETEEEGKGGFASVADFEVNAKQLMEGLNLKLSGVSSKASAGAKSVGSFFSSAFSKAGASVKEASSRIKETVEKNPLVSEFNKEQEAFIKEKGGKPGQAVPPWVGYPQEEAIKEEIMSLSTDRRNFVRSPPAGVNFEFDLEQFLPMAEATLAVDSNLEKMRFELVPKVVNEESFWRNYFYRVGLIRQSPELSSLEKGTSEADDGGNIENKKANKGEEDWEAELREQLGEELNEYEVVGGAKDNVDWEQELESMLTDKDTKDINLL